MTSLRVYPAKDPLRGSVLVPADKSITHRAILFASLARGSSLIRRFLPGEDNLRTMRAFENMGVHFELDGTNLEVKGVGLFGLKPPKTPIDCGNSGTTMRLLTGLLAAQTFDSVLVGDASLSVRPMYRVISPLSLRGAKLKGSPHPTRPGEVTAPLHIFASDAPLAELEFHSPVASAQVKSALLISGLYANGATLVHEPCLSRDHTERMLLNLKVPVKQMANIVMFDPTGWQGFFEGFELEVPGDLSAAAFLLAAAHFVEGSHITVRQVGINPTRTGFLEVLRDMRAGLEVFFRDESAGEPTAEIHAWYTKKSPVQLGGERVARAIDEIPILCALAALADGETQIRDAEELRVKESNRLLRIAELLRQFGVSCLERDDGILVRGEGAKRPLRGVETSSYGDHRIAMTATVMALAADSPSFIHDAECIATSFPKFVATLRALGATIDVLK